MTLKITDNCTVGYPSESWAFCYKLVNFCERLLVRIYRVF